MAAIDALGQSTKSLRDKEAIGATADAVTGAEIIDSERGALS